MKIDYNRTYQEAFLNLFRNLHLSRSQIKKFFESGMDYRTFLKEMCGAEVPAKPYWYDLRIVHGVGNGPLQLGGGNAIIWSRNPSAGEVLVLMQKRRLEKGQRVNRWGFTGGGYQNWSRKVGNKTYHAQENPFLCAYREAEEEIGTEVPIEDMVFFNEETATSYPGGQVVLHVSIFYLLEVPYTAMEKFMDGGSEEGKMYALTLKDLKELDRKGHIFAACQETVKKLLRELQ